MPGVFEQILDPANRANPYTLWAELRRTPVAPQPDGSYVVSTYRAVSALTHDPRLSSDVRPPEAKARGKPSFINLDPPEHDRIRRWSCGTSARRSTRPGSTRCARACSRSSPR
jgi:cytochrome P450